MTLSLKGRDRKLQRAGAERGSECGEGVGGSDHDRDQRDDDAPRPCLLQVPTSLAQPGTILPAHQTITATTITASTTTPTPASMR